MARFTRSRPTHVPLGATTAPNSQTKYWHVITFLFAANMALVCTVLYLVLEIDQYYDKNSRRLYLGISWGLIFTVTLLAIWFVLAFFVRSCPQVPSRTAGMSRVESEYNIIKGGLYI